jgi:hypothetical protein
VYARHEKAEAVAVLGEADATLDEGADLEGPVDGEILMEGGCVVANYRLRDGEWGYGKKDSEDPDRRGGEASHAIGQSIVSVVFRLVRLCWQKKAAGERRPLPSSTV